MKMHATRSGLTCLQTVHVSTPTDAIRSHAPPTIAAATAIPTTYASRITSALGSSYLAFLLGVFLTAIFVAFPLVPSAVLVNPGSP